MRWIIILLLGAVIWTTTIFETNTTPLEQYLNVEGDCQLPCLFGITPGVTTLDEAETIIQASDIQFSDETGIWFEIDNTRISVSLRQDPRQNYISSIILNPYHPQHILTLDTLIEQYSLPSQVYRQNINGQNSVSLLLVFDETEQIVVHVSGFHHVTESLPVTRIELFAEQDKHWRMQDILNRGYEYAIRWIGYAPIEDYLNLAS